MTTASAEPKTPSITESRFDLLKAKLRELFELDKSDLDFGIYRIINARNKEITEFLDRQLRQGVAETLAEHGAGEAGAAQAELDKAIAQAKELGVDPDTSEKVKALRAKVAAAGGGAAGEIEADVYNHLLNFFSRYYEEGDFISKRRYKGDTYAIPYSGEEVTLHWANKDQYYIKSGEWHRDYRFRIGDHSVRFKLVEATQEVGNNKERDDAKRRYVLDEEQPVEASERELVLRFQFRAPTEGEKARAGDGAVAIWGGKFAASTKGDEREQFCADAEMRAMEAMSEVWRKRVDATAATDAKPSRTLLGKHLDQFTARNTFDYFIHKDLGAFLRRELDFYIKNEVVRLDDIDAAPPDQLLRMQGRVKAIRRVAGRVIDLLASIEDFQKKMWLKKKFVLNTNWLVTIDRVPAKLRDVVATNKAQWEEWERLGFKPEETADGLFRGATWGTREYLDVCDKLPLNTRHFGDDFIAELLATESLATNGLFDSRLLGITAHGENSQVLQLLQERYRERIQCVYIDPPYNSNTSEIAYKNSYKHSSWLALMDGRLSLSRPLSTDDGSHVIAIDENEHEVLGQLLSQCFPSHEKVEVAVIHNKKGIQGNYFSFNHEYAFFCIPPSLPETRGQPVAEDEWEYANLRKWGRESDRKSARNCFYLSMWKTGRSWDSATYVTTMNIQPVLMFAMVRVLRSIRSTARGLSENGGMRGRPSREFASY